MGLDMRRLSCFLGLLFALGAGGVPTNAQERLPPANSDEDDVTELVSWEENVCCDESESCLHCALSNRKGEAITVALLNPTNRLKLHAGLDTLMVFSTKRPFPSGMPLFLFPDSPFGLESNTFDLHARQSYVGALFSGPNLGTFQTGGQIHTFLQNDSLSTDDYGLLVYYAYGELKNEDWRFAAGLQQDVFNPVSPTVVYLTKLYASGNTGSYRGQLRAERFLQQGDLFGMTIQAAVSEPLSTLVTTNIGRITEDNGWPNVEARIELGFGPLCEKHGSNSRSLEIGISGIGGQFRTSETLLANPPSPSPRAIIDTWGIGTDFEWRPNAFVGSARRILLWTGIG